MPIFSQATVQTLGDVGKSIRFVGQIMFILGATAAILGCITVFAVPYGIVAALTPDRT